MGEPLAQAGEDTGSDAERPDETEGQPQDGYSQLQDDYNYTRDDDSENSGDTANSVVSSVEPSEETKRGQSARRQSKLRKRFGPDDDYLLAVQVLKDTPFKAKHGAIRSSWEALAVKLNGSPNFLMEPIKGTTAQARFDTLLEKHRAWESKSAGKTGSDERETRFVTVMTNLQTKVDDYKKEKDDIAAKIAGVERAKVQAGEVVRAAAVSRIQMGKRTTVEVISNSGGDSVGQSRTKKQKSGVAAEWAGLVDEMKADRAQALERFVQTQQDELKQRNKELEFEREEREIERVEREKEREKRRNESIERQKERQEQAKLITTLLQIAQAKMG
ncbi:hypothetical protein GN244_ATG14283 [Phytophthora infestans]|uniref:Uncharacterized protein n=1 Tax=Phytophthora infestans TaxID=4787 RepID=A0A833WGN0_PHYIN|nr:hypothetical protein GN244_ATG14283 [Phytophthora infestans]KAI9983277.1 hypothetical protein PInf_007232 [Phytophthora infestans]